jgi:inhibitor of cysteine peptidase
VPVELSESNSASPHVVARNEDVVVRLAENPTTGYRWEVTQSGVGELRLVDDQFIAGTGGTTPGAGGHRVLRFTAQRPGNIELAAVKRRSWEPVEASTEQRRYSLVVK